MSTTVRCSKASELVTVVIERHQHADRRVRAIVHRRLARSKLRTAYTPSPDFDPEGSVLVLVPSPVPAAIATDDDFEEGS